MKRLRFDDDELASQLSTLPGWTASSSQIEKSFTFDSYKAGLAFAVCVGWQADRLDHHPDITVGYQRVTVRTWTHDRGGVTDCDIELARAVEMLF